MASCPHSTPRKQKRQSLPRIGCLLIWAGTLLHASHILLHCTGQNMSPGHHRLPENLCPPHRARPRQGCSSAGMGRWTPGRPHRLSVLGTLAAPGSRSPSPVYTWDAKPCRALGDLDFLCSSFISNIFIKMILSFPAIHPLKEHKATAVGATAGLHSRHHSQCEDLPTPAALICPSPVLLYPPPAADSP